MKRVIRNIDRALKRLYRLESPLRAEDFLLSQPLEAATIAHAGLKGALYIRASNADLSVGIFLSEEIRNRLTTFPQGVATSWPFELLEAYLVATEEISHFHYLIHHTGLGRQVSPLEMEIQGEIDKFLVAFFTNAHSKSREQFEKLFSKLFQRFTLAEALNETQRNRYQEANRLAMRFLRRQADSLLQANIELTLRRLRRFYRLSAAEKISEIEY